ncbi:Multiple epidermal growth factor-like domains protein 8 [Blomia tropicalis]|nr:Multiple epidermal growth factor-like domains protein 8 [Blomia tropicalis]
MSSNGESFEIIEILHLFLCLLFSSLYQFSDAKFVNNCGNGRQIFSNTTQGFINNYDGNVFNCEWLITTRDLSLSTNSSFINLHVIFNETNHHSDTLYIFDGLSYENQLIASLNVYSPTDRKVFASSGSMLLLHYWDEDHTPSRFTATFTVTECQLNCSNHGLCVNNSCICNHPWKGDACQIDSCPKNCSHFGQCVNNLTDSSQECSTIASYSQCICTNDYIGQSCDVLNQDSAKQRRQSNVKVPKWKLFSNLSPGRASHASVYMPLTDSIYVYGGRHYEFVFGDLLTFSFKTNRWHNLTCSQIDHPKPLWGHTLSIFNSSLVLFGGIFADGTLSNELWFFDVSTKQWTLSLATKTNFDLFPLAFHTATLVNNQSLYIFGGRFQNGSHLQSFYRIDFTHSYNEINHTANLVRSVNENQSYNQIVGHTAIFYAPLESIIIFGGATLIGNTNRLNNQIQLFHVHRKVWSRLKFSENEEDIPGKRAFHSMLLFEHHLVVFGGHLRTKNETNDADNRLHVYSLLCHQWSVLDTRDQSFPLSNLVSTSLIIRNNLIFLIGGFSGHVHGEVYVYSLSKRIYDNLQAELCSQHQSLNNCKHQTSCNWCRMERPNHQVNNTDLDGYCSHNKVGCSRKPLRKQCPGLCTRLTNCYSCVTTIANPDNHGNDNGKPIGNSCRWDPFELSCVTSIDLNHLTLHLVSNYFECVHHNIESGVTFYKYNYPQNRSQPDEVKYLKNFEVKTSFREKLAKNVFISTPEIDFTSFKSDNTSLVNIARIFGFVHPFGLEPFHNNSLRLFLSSTSPQASLRWNGEAKILENISTNKSYYQSFIDLPMNSEDISIEDNFLIDLIVKFPIRTTFHELEYETIELGLEHNSVVNILSNWNLRPYHNTIDCNQTKMCLTCISNLGCAWDSISRQCFMKSEIQNLKTGHLLVIEPEQCSLCADIIECKQCAQHYQCEWVSHDGGLCVRRGRFSDSIRNPTACPMTCFHRQSCQSCIDDSNQCAWCQTSKQCISISSYKSSPSFDFCPQIDINQFKPNPSIYKLLNNSNPHYNATTSSIMKCSKCLRHSTCLTCQNDFSCSWCSNRDDHSLGFCSEKILPNENVDCNHLMGIPLNEVYVSSLQSKCPLVNECQLDKHNCHSNGICIDTEHSFRCICKPGFTGDGITCIRTCNNSCIHGYCSEFPDYRCICDLGWTGDDCSVDCGCNGHSSCSTGIGICDYCEHNTRGKHCQLCSIGSYGMANSSIGCTKCNCNGHGNEELGLCDSDTGICHCLNYTEGVNCERCEVGFYGDPQNNEPCFMECNHRAFISDFQSGFFGSYIRQLHFGKHNRLLNKDHFNENMNINCLWIFTSYSSPREYNSFELYYGVNKQLRALPIAITIFGSHLLNCTLSRVLVYDGIPQFVSASNQTESTILANICGTRAINDTNLIASSGFVTVVYRSENLFQGFNASYLQLSSTETKVISSNQTKPTNITKSVTKSLWSMESRLSNNTFDDTIWPNRMHSQFYLHDSLIFVGGQERSIPLSLAIFNLTTKSWSKPIQSDTRPNNRIMYGSAILNEEIFIFGGLEVATNQAMNDLWSCHISSKENNRFWRWRAITPLGNETIPPLMGHSLTAITFASMKALILMGGYSSSYGFLEKQYIFIPKVNRWKVLRTKGSAPIGIFGHAAIYHSTNRQLFVFGGADFKESQQTVISNALYILNLDNLVWRRHQPENVTDINWPLPRFLSTIVTTQDYLLIMGGKTGSISSPGFTTNSLNNLVFAYRYQCNKWIALGNSSLIRNRSSWQILSATTMNNTLYAYEQSSESFSLITLKLPIDLCSFHMNSMKSCRNIIGCSFKIVQFSNHSTSECVDINTIISDGTISRLSMLKEAVLQGTKCERETIATKCEIYDNCIDCTTHNQEMVDMNGHESCQWCTDCHHRDGRCIALNDTCDWFEVNSTLENRFQCANISVDLTEMCPSRQCLATDCDKCLKQSAIHHDRPRCVWTRQVHKLVQSGHLINMSPMFDWACVQSSIIEWSPLATEIETVPPLACPARCHRHKTCSLCLEGATGDEGGIHECVWSEITQECVSPTYYSLLSCESANCYEFVQRQPYSQCPVDCNSLNKAIDCLSVSHCGWCALDGFELDGIGLCMKGGLFGSIDNHCSEGENYDKLVELVKTKPFYNASINFAIKWHYLYLPRENECKNGHHTCDHISQECVDLEDGFMCRCKSGFKMIDNTCKPICLQGCVNGICIKPDVCGCTFGYIGHDCSLECECNGHSTCPSSTRLAECTECHNNTQGYSCEQCKPFFVGDPRHSGSCQSCSDYCNNHSDKCFDVKLINESFNNLTSTDTFWYELIKGVGEGPRSDAVCIDCANNTEGERCDRCKLGYFKISEDIRDGCRLCECNQHGLICNPFNGENCNCQNNTENDRQCNYLNTKEYSNYVNKTYFFKSTHITSTYSLPCWKVQCSKCKDYFYGVPTNGHQCYRHMHPEKEYCFDPVSQDECIRNPRELSHGRVIFFGVQPRYMNVDIKIVLSVVKGAIDMYLFSKDNMFIVKGDQAGFHHTFLDRSFIQNKFLINISKTLDTPANATLNGDLWWLSIDDGNFDRFAYTLKNPFFLNSIRLNGSSPYYHSMANLNEITIIRNVRQRLEVTIPYRTHDLRTTRYYFILRANDPVSFDSSYGLVLFRQDQCKIDLFVFFSVFFSCFFLFTCMSVIVWKLKMYLEYRRAQHMHEIELEHLANRPFALIYVLFDSIFEFDHVTFHKVKSSVPETPSKKMSLFRHFTLGFKESPKVYPECAQSAAKFDTKETENSIKPVSIEFTSDGLAAIITTFVRLPGGNLAPNRFAAASTLVSLKNSPQIMQSFLSMK